MDGLKIINVFEGGNAEKAGLQAGDELISIDDYRIKSFQDFIDARNNCSDQMKVSVIRYGKFIEFTVNLSEESRSAKKELLN